MTGYGLYLSAAGMKVNDHRQALIANNMANAATPGFKHDLAVISQRMVESRESIGGSGFTHPVLDGLAGGVNIRPSFHSFAQGPLEDTGNPMDVALEGDGFLVVSDGADTRYTRDGRLMINEQGDIVLAAGDGRWKLLSDAGAPIKVDRNGPRVRVSAGGAIKQGDTVVATLGASTTADKQSLRKVGENLFEATAEMSPATPRFRPGAIEGSTFDVMQGLAAMIEATRAFEMNANLIRIQDELTGQVVSTVGRVLA